MLFGSLGSLHLYDDPDHALKAVKTDGKATVWQPDAHGNGSGVIDEFLSAIEENRPSVLDIGQISGSMRALFAAEQSARTGQAAALK